MSFSQVLLFPGSRGAPVKPPEETPEKRKEQVKLFYLPAPEEKKEKKINIASGEDVYCSIE